MWNKIFDFMDKHGKIGYAIGIAMFLAFIGMVLTGGYYYQKAIQASSQAETLCKMVKPEMLNPGVCE